MTLAAWCMGCGALIAAGLGAVGCADEPAAHDAGSFVANERIIYNDGLHNENTAMLALDDRILLVFRGGETGQVGSEKAHLNVYASTDGGATFAKQAEINANNLPDGRDIRDPKLVRFRDHLYLYAISRLPGGHYRDLFGIAWTVRSESTDQGKTWSPPVQTFDDPNDFWGFWRFTERDFVVGGEAHRTLYATGYDDGDKAVGFFASEDGVSWEKRATIIDSPDDVPSETELQFMGPNQATAVALVRLDNAEILQDGQTAICTAVEPFTSWECGRRIEQRLDGPHWLVRTIDGVRRDFVVARKHLPCTFKRTAIYEVRGDLATPGAPIEVCEIEELPSAGDTAYTSLAPRGDPADATDQRFVVSWYSSVVGRARDVPWLEGQFTHSEIWMADLDFARAPSTCVHPAPKPTHACEPPALPSPAGTFAVGGKHLLALAPIIWPEQALLFEVDMQIAAGTLTMTLQPLSAATHAPVGAPWVASGPLGADGTFALSFADEPLAAEVFPLLEDPFLTVHALVFEGETTSADGFCGRVAGYAQVYGDSPADRITLDGSTFGAVRIPASGALPSAVSACPGP